MRHVFAAAAGLILALSSTGCLLPQPDTPPIPPGSQSTVGAPNPGKGAAQPNVGDSTPQTGTPMVPSVSPSASPSASPSPGGAHLKGRVQGDIPYALQVVNFNGGFPYRQELAPDGLFDLLVPAGTYWVELTFQQTTVRLAQTVSVDQNQTRSLLVTGTANPPGGTLQDAPSPTPSPSPSP